MSLSPAPASPGAAEFVTAHPQPTLLLLTLARGDGLLGLRPHGPFGPRAVPLTVVRIEWRYRGRAGVGGWQWSVPAPRSVLAPRGEAEPPVGDDRGAQLRLRRDLAAEADAADLLATLGLHPVDEDALQWRSPEAAGAIEADQLWSLPQEGQFADFWAERVPRLQARGWAIIVGPGFAHQSVPILAWQVGLHPETGELQGHTPAASLAMPGSGLPLAGPRTALGPVGLQLPAREGSWLLSLGIAIDGESLDLAPLLADLLQRDPRWLDAAHLARIDDIARIELRAPGGRRIDAEAAPLKAIVRHLLDLLTDPLRRAEPLAPATPLRLSHWDAPRLHELYQDLRQIAAGHLQAGTGHASGRPWRFDGEDDLQRLATRLRADDQAPSVAAPAGLNIALRPYQLQGLAWLQDLRRLGLNGILADEMGLGKTAQTLAHLLLEKGQGRLDLPALIVLPTSLLANWQAEARRIAPELRVLRLHGPARSEDFARLAGHDLVLTTYPLLWRDIDALRAQAWHLLVLDEAQLVKNAASRSARALRRLRARHRLCLSGTPLENNLGELWAQFDFLMPGFLGTARQFWQTWRKPIEVNGESLRAELLARRVRPFILRRRKQEVASELPERVEILRRVRLEGSQRDLYESVRVAADKQVRRVLQRSGFAGAQVHILDALLKLRQVCCDPALLPSLSGTPNAAGPAPTHRAKLELLRELLPALVAEGRRILVVSQFVRMLEFVEQQVRAAGLTSLSLTGDTPPEVRGAMVQEFQQGHTPIFLLSLKAGGLGLNLTAADAVVLIDPWWNPAVEEQAAARAHRIGQQRTVFIYRLLAEGSIEERMLALQLRKTRLAEGVLGHDLGAAVKFSDEDLQALLAPLDSAASLTQ